MIRYYGIEVKMQKKIFAVYLGLILCVMLIFLSWTYHALSQSVERQYQLRFTEDLQMIENMLSDSRLVDDDVHIVALSLFEGTDTRVTVIDETGIVLADTHESFKVMDNHANREEVLKAKDSGAYGMATRFSDTIQEKFIYVAKKIVLDNTIYYIRLSAPLTMVSQINRDLLGAGVLVFTIILGVTLLLGYMIGKRLIGPIDHIIAVAEQISKGDYSQKIYSHSNDDLGRLALALNKMRENLAQTMDNLVSQHAELQAILNSMANGVVAVDKQRQIMLINQTAREILRLPEGIVGLQDSMYRIIRSDEIIEMINASIDDGQQQVKELFHVHLEKYLRVFIHPILTEDRGILGSMIVIEDVSQIKKLENMRSEFVSNVSHELKTPLTSIMGFVDTLKSGAIEDRDRAIRFLDIIEKESHRLNRLISDILLLSEIENAQKEPDASDVDLLEVIEEVVSMLQIRLENKPVELNIFCDQAITMTINRDRVKQMLINLIDNAIKYTELGYVNVSLRKSDTWAEFVIEDSGIGIPDAHKVRLFERFYRVDKARSRKVGGTGLGLSIVKHIVNQYRGEIEVDSALGEGSRFTVRLPILRNM